MYWNNMNEMYSIIIVIVIIVFGIGIVDPS